MPQNYVTMNQAKSIVTNRNAYHLKSDLAYSSWYSLNISETKYAVVGVSPYKNFNTIIKLVSMKTSNVIYFTIEEWKDLLVNESLIIEFFQTDSKKLKSFVIGNIRLSSYMIGGKKILQFTSSNSSLSLEATSIDKLFNIAHIIQCNVDSLQNLKFCEYFDNFMNNLNVSSEQLISKWNKLFFLPNYKKRIKSELS